ncbi:hypothetical protein PS634_05359 [Pseudomonas fluorescens]|nr:hypothetical protein PS634_05359 [Pseudomonas fluorescens]
MKAHNQTQYPQRRACCPLCQGTGGPIEIECRDCDGTGFDPTEEKPFAQCHTCYGDETEEVETCIRCGGSGEIDEDGDR